MNQLNDKTYSQVLSEASDFFGLQGISILGRGYEEIASNAALFESYVDHLTEGCSADSAAEMAQIMSNTNANILKESSVTGIQPVASLSMPVIRKLWPTFALKNAVKREVAKSPRFVVAYTKPYLFRGDGERIELPKGLTGYSGKGLTDDDTLFDNNFGKDLTVAHNFELAAGAATVVDFTYKLSPASGAEVDPVVSIADSPSTSKLQPLDELILVSAKVGTTGTTESDEVIKLPIGKRLGVYGNGVYPFETKDGKKGQLIVQFDGAARKATFAVVGDFTGKVVKLSVKAAVSSEYNEASWSVGFDLKREDIDIPTGQHINAPLPIEALNDMMALYQIDGTKETVDLMTNVFAQKLDVEILDFLRDSFANQPTNDAFAGYPGASEYLVTFDCKPAAGFAGSPKAWREELKPLIDHVAQKIKNNTYLTTGVFNIIGNPLDVQILANIDWSYRGGQGGNLDGVDVDYSLGTYVGANAYKVIASTNVPAGALYIVFLPDSDKQLTYKYYPYTFSTEMGYIDPNRSRVPSLMMTKRHTMYAFMPAIGAILIEHNDGASYFATSIPTTNA